MIFYLRSKSQLTQETHTGSWHGIWDQGSGYFKDQGSWFSIYDRNHSYYKKHIQDPDMAWDQGSACFKDQGSGSYHYDRDHD